MDGTYYLYSPPTHLNFTLFFYSENFQPSLSQWTYFNVFIYHSLIVLLLWLLKLKLKEGILFLFFSTFFHPYEINLLVGQLGILVFLGFALYFWGLKKENSLLQGLGISIAGVLKITPFVLLFVTFLFKNIEASKNR